MNQLKKTNLTLNIVLLILAAVIAGAYFDYVSMKLEQQHYDNHQ